MRWTDRGEILSVQNISKRYGDTAALTNVDFNLLAGEVHCLVGENGAGKSTLIKILSGAEQPDNGRIQIFGKEYAHLTPRQALEVGISTIYQDLELITSLTVADNIFLGHEIKRRYGIIDYHTQNRKARELIDSLDVDINESAYVEDLSLAKQQMVQVVKALYTNAKIIIMDEPTASLGIEETKALMDLVRRLASQGMGVIYISHYLGEIFEIGDRITVLKDGRVQAMYNTEEVDLDTVTRSMIGRERSLFYDRQRVAHGNTVLRVHNLSKRGSFEDVSFDLRKGEILGFGGIVGAGRSEVMNAIFGVEPKDGGKIFIHGREVNPKSPWEAIRLGLAMIPEDRKTLGLFDIRSVLENMVIVRNEATGLVLDHVKEQEFSKDLVQRLHVVTAGLKQPVGFLSGGNQQKVILARWLLSDAQILIFDEPTKGVDIGAKAQIYKLMVDLVKEGKSILMVSSDMPELMSMSDRIAVVREGRLVTIVDSKQVTEHELLGCFLEVHHDGGVVV